jgi:hypothetical protein
MINGHISLNGVTNDDLIMILHEKGKHPDLIFDPQKLQPVNVGGQSGQAPRQIYNSCILGWPNEQTLRVVYRIVHKLLHGHADEPS